MPIISASPIEKRIFRITMTYGQGIIENMVINDTGEYQIYYMKNCKSHNETGKIVNIVYNQNYTKNSYILFDYECDICSHKHAREKIFFHEIIFIKDVTPTDAYMIAVQRGFQGSVDDWLESMRGPVGKSAYEICVEQGFEGSIDEWICSLRGPRGLPGKDAYQLAVEFGGYKGTREEFASMYKTIQESVIYVNSFNDRVEALEEYNSGVDKLVSDMSQEVSSLKHEIKQVSEKTDSALSKIGQLGESFEADQEIQNKKIEALTIANETNTKAIENVSNEVSTTSETLNKKIDEEITEVTNTLNKTISNTESNINKTIAEVESNLNGKIKTTNEELVKTASTIRKEIEEVNVETNKKITNLSEDVNNKITKLNETDEEIKKSVITLSETVDKKIDEVSIATNKSINEVVSRINETNADMNELAQNVHAANQTLEKEIGTVQQNLKEVQEVIDDELVAKVDKAISDIDQLTEDVEEIKDAVTWKSTM